MRETKSVLVTLVVALLFSLLILGNLKTAEVQASSYLSKSGSALEFLIIKAEGKLGPRLLPRGGSMVGIPKVRKPSVSIRFDHELTEAEIAKLEALGLVFERIGGEVAHSGKIYGARLPIGSVNVLKDRPDVLRIESTWKPAVHYPLDVSVPEINADDMWQLLDGVGDNITGEGITVADFDTGIDVFHPDFWNADGGSYAWIDTNTNGTFDPGIDAVDLNVNAVADPTETLDFFDAEGGPGNNDGVFQADLDWLYNDANNNRQRDYGTASGFTEADPTYGELIFIADDTNGNNTLDVGENLLALGTSKVARTMNAGTERIRGTDLILSDDDTNGHGTSVCGIINGGVIGRRYVGVAPSAELLVSHGTDHTIYIPWARTNGADVMLYEFGTWVQEFMDGSSNLEQMIDAEAALGIVQVVPAGNLGHKDKHAQDDVAANGGSTSFTFNVPSTDDPGTGADEDIDRVFITALWRTTGNDLVFSITTPTPSNVNLPASPGDTSWHSVTSADGHTVYYRREDSSRGTAKYDITIERNKVILGGWTLQVSNNSASNEHVDMYIADNRTSWSGGALWTAFQANENTIDWPATADSAIVVASYSTRGWDVAAGDLSNFSPEGPRIDGQSIMDIAAPGNFDIASAISKDAGGGTLGGYRWFSGTSAAGPHVAGASALLLQWGPTLNHGQVQTMLQQSARTDAFTGVTPNEEWGHGKLDVLAAVNEPPVCDANGPYQAECQYPSTTISLDAAGSSDPNAGDMLTYSWSTDCPGGSFDDPTSPAATLSVDYGCFSCNVPLTVTDLAGESDTCTATVTVEDTQAPSIVCPADATIECDQPTDPSNTGWATAADACDPSPDVTYSDMVTPGTCPQEETITRTWTATDGCGNFRICLQRIEVVDTTPPIIHVVTATPDILWPPNHKMVQVTVAATATDNCDPTPDCTITRVRSNEPVRGFGDGNTAPDWFITGNLTVYLRAERSGRGDGRFYTITVSCTDECDNSSEATAVVTVPHDKGKGKSKK